MTHERTMRLSQTIAPFGVGAIYDYNGESLLACDTSLWRNAGDRLELPRLADELRVDGFRSAPVIAPSGRRARPLPFMRFPRWLFCTSCREMRYWVEADEQPGEPARCRTCTHHPQLVPMRFVLTCRAGHLSDFPWDRWAHLGASDRQKPCRSRDLEFRTRPQAGAGLAGLIVRCRTCRAEQSLAGITGSVERLGVACVGRQPWERLSAPPSCDEQPIVVQRGASNLYFADVQSAIDIPPSSNYDVFDEEVALVSNSAGFPLLTSSDDEDTIAFVVRLIAKDTGLSEQKIRDVAAADINATEGRRTAHEPTGDLRRDEWNALLDTRPQDGRDRFLTRRVPLVDDEGAEPDDITMLLTRRLESPVLVTRLREVRALTGFRRYEPTGPRQSPHLGNPRIRWLPAIEVYGEGIFLPFAEAQLTAWEARREVRERAQVLETRRVESLIGQRVPHVSARLVMLHTFAHLLIRQLAFESGYAAASLRERIYCAETGGTSEPFAGVLVYTAAGDAEGTLGGLVRQGRPPRMLRTIVAMLEAAAWCSADPICIESGGQGFESLNLGACHACSLLSETSCELSNSFLDRRLLVDDETGFFAPVLAAALNAGAARAD